MKVFRILAAFAALVAVLRRPVASVPTVTLLGILLVTVPATGAAEESGAEPGQLAALVAEAKANNPEIAAARSELEAARQRIPAAGALDDPMLELGIANAPLPSMGLGREDMTMKMLGLSQRLPFPGKRRLRRAVAEADSDGLGLAVEEIANRIERDVRVTYEELALNEELQRVIARTGVALEQLAAIARARYRVGQAVQGDALDAQIEIERLEIERLHLAADNASLQGELQRLLGRAGPTVSISAAARQLAADPMQDAAALDSAAGNRPQLLALQALVEKNTHAIDLAQREYYPDFDIRLQYGQRDRAPDGRPRDDMVTLTVGFSLPVWRRSRLEPQVAEARALRRQAQSTLLAQQFETRTTLRTQLALVHQWRSTAERYRESLLPQARAATESALAAYRVGRIDFDALRQAQLREFEASTELATAIANHNRAIAEVDLLAGHRKP